MEPQGPFLPGMDALIAAVGRELDAPVVSRDSDLDRCPVIIDTRIEPEVRVPSLYYET